MKQQLKDRFRPRIEHVTWAVLIYCSLVAAMWPRRTYDIWWHLATGKIIVEDRTIPDSDPFTWTRAGTPWITHEWGWEVLMYLFYSRGGHAGLLLLRSAVAVGATLILIWLCVSRGARPLATIGVGALGLFAARPLFNDRPQIVSILFFAAMLAFIEMSERGRERRLLIVPLLMILWVNLHGGFIFGPALLVLYAACCVPHWWRQLQAGNTLHPAPTVLAAAIVLSIAACLINPHGVAGALYPLSYVRGENAWHKTWISEYKSPDFSSPIFFYLALLIVGATAIFALSRRRTRVWDLALVTAFLLLTLKWQRNAALYAFAVIPTLAVHLSGVLDDLGLARFGSDAEEREPTVFYGTIIVVLALLAGLAVPSALRKIDRTFSEDMPVEAVRYIEEVGLQGRMFNTYRWGGYLIWHLWPEHKVFIDGRADVMGKELSDDWQTAHKLKDGWEEVLTRYRIDWAVISESSPLCRALDLHPNWRCVLKEPAGRLYVRRGSVADIHPPPVD